MGEYEYLHGWQPRGTMMAMARAMVDTQFLRRDENDKLMVRNAMCSYVMTLADKQGAAQALLSPEQVASIFASRTADVKDELHGDLRAVARRFHDICAPDGQRDGIIAAINERLA